MNQATRYVATQGNPLIITARVADASGNLLIIASVESITVTVVNAETQAVTHTASPAPDLSVFDTLQLTPLWTTDAIGYNLGVVAEGFNEGDVEYQVQIVVTPTAGEPFTLVAMVRTRPLY